MFLKRQDTLQRKLDDCNFVIYRLDQEAGHYRNYTIVHINFKASNHFVSKVPELRKTTSLTKNGINLLLFITATHGLLTTH